MPVGHVFVLVISFESGQLEEMVTIQLFFCFLCRRCLGLMEESCNGFVCGVFEGIGL